LGAPGLAALLLVQILPVLHPTVHKTHGGDPALRSSRRFAGARTARSCAPWGGGGRIAGLGATLDVHHGLLRFEISDRRPYVCNLKSHATYAVTPNVNTVVDAYFAPGRRIAVGKLAWFGESGKCWVSRQKPLRLPYTCPLLPTADPSSRFPE
jgi:hypothetical protein